MRTGDRKKKRREEAFPADFDDRIMPGDDLLPDDFVAAGEGRSIRKQP